MLSTLALVEDLLDHLNTDVGIVAQIGDGAVFHATVDRDQPTPFVLFSFPRINLRDAQGFGADQESGQVAEATIVLGIINEQHDPKGLGDLANAADTALRAWAPSDWEVRELEALEERTASLEEEGQTLQSATMQYRLILERN